MLAPDIVEAILDGTQGPDVTLARVLEPFPLEWSAQPGSFGLEKTSSANTAPDCVGRSTARHQATQGEQR